MALLAAPGWAWWMGLDPNRSLSFRKVRLPGGVPGPFKVSNCMLEGMNCTSPFRDLKRILEEINSGKINKNWE